MSLPPMPKMLPALHKPALSALEEKAATVLALFEYCMLDPTSKVRQDAWTTAVHDFVRFEAGYLGLDPLYTGAHERAKEYTAGI